MDVTVTSVVRETHDSATITLATPAGRPAYKAGQFLSVRPHVFPELAQFTRFLEHLKGNKEPIRAYSLASAPHEKDIAFTVKEEPYDPKHDPYPCLLSPFFSRGLTVGRTFQITGFTGPYVIPDDLHEKTDTVLHVCAGSGIVPNYGMLKDQLHRGTPLKHILLYGNKTADDIIYLKQLTELQAAHPGKLRIIHTLSRDPNATSLGPDYRTGRFTTALLKEFAPDPQKAHVFSCGPAITKHQRKEAKKTGVEPTPRFMETVHDAIKELGIPDANFHEESFG